MTTIRAFSLACIAFTALLLTTPCTAGEVPAQPSIVLLTVDTLRADHMSPNPRGARIAPFLSSLAEEALVFSSAHSTSCWTVPAAVTLATGLYPQSHGITVGISKNGGVVAQPAISSKIPRLAEKLQQAGYRTYAVLSNAHLSGELGFAQGFDHFKGVGFTSAEQVLAALEPWHEQLRSGASPFFLWLHFFDPHLPYHPREPWISTFAPDITDEERRVLDLAQETWPRPPAEMLSQPARYLEIGRSLYDSEIAYLDHAIAGLFEALPVLDRSMVIFTADHGEEFREHGRFGHGNNLFAPTVQIPLWVRQPGGGPGVSNDRVVSLIDVPPTILAAAGGEIPGNWPGLSLLQPIPEDRAVLSQLAKVKTRRLEGLINSHWKLVRTEPAGRSELYDLTKDDGEHHDLADTQPKELAAREKQLAELLAALPSPSEVPPDVPVSAENLEMLRQLGYAEAEE